MGAESLLAAGAITSGLGGLAGGLFGGSAAKKRAKEQKGLWKQSLSLYGDFLNDPNSLLTQGGAQYGAAIDTLKSGFKDAKLNLGMAGNAARQTTNTQGAQAQAANTQSMMSRGLYGTTALDNARMGISSAVSRQLAQIDESIGAQLAGLQTQGAMATAGAQQSYGGYLGNAYGAKQNTLENYINLLRDKPASWNSKAYYGGMLGQAAQGVGNMMAFSAGKGGA